MDSKYLKNINDCYKVFKLVGLYRPKNLNIVQRIYGFFSQLLFIEMSLVLQLLYFSQIDNIVDFADHVSVNLTYLAIVSRSYSLIYNFEKLEVIVDILKELLELSNENQPNFGIYIDKRMKSIRKVFKFYYGTCLCAISLSSIVTILTVMEPPYNPQYKLYPPSFFNFQKNYNYFLIVEVLEFIGPLFSACSAVSLDFLSVFFYSIGAGMYEELTERIKQIELKVISKKYKLNEKEKWTITELKQCIVIHAKIKEFLDAVQKFLSPIIFIQIVISTAIICMSAYTISMFSPLNGGSIFFRQASYIIPMVLQIFIPCFYGNEIMIAAEQFSMNIFHIKWYLGSKKFRNNFRILLMHAKQPIIMVSGMMFKVTLENFVAVIQLAYRFYAVMQNMSTR